MVTFWRQALPVDFGKNTLSPRGISLVNSRELQAALGIIMKIKSPTRKSEQKEMKPFLSTAESLSCSCGNLGRYYIHSQSNLLMTIDKHKKYRSSQEPWSDVQEI